MKPTARVLSGWGPYKGVDRAVQWLKCKHLSEPLKKRPGEHFGEITVGDLKKA